MQIFDHPLLTVSAHLVTPDGLVLDLTDPVMSGTSYNFIAEVNSFDDSDVGSYTCTAIVNAQPPSAYLTGTGQLSHTIQIMIGENSCCSQDI